MRKIFLPLLLVALSPVAHSEGVQEVEIDAPLSGWHPAEGEDASFSQSINYPASSVNMADDQNISAQIRGKIKNYPQADMKQDFGYRFDFQVRNAYRDCSRIPIARIRACLAILRDLEQTCNSTAIPERTAIETAIVKMLTMPEKQEESL